MKYLVIVLLIGFSLLVDVESSVIEVIPKDNGTQAAISHHEENVVRNKSNGHPRHIVFIPFLRPYKSNDNSSNDTCEDSDDDFPEFFLTDKQIKYGGIIIVILIGIYGFTLLAVVCNFYFLPCVETICEVVHLTPDVAAATFMSVATSTPELFTNIIGTFVTQSDLGIGTIVGSSLFNGLGVAAIGSLAAPRPLQLDWWPVTRDCSIYVCAVAILVVITWDGAIFWYEATILMIAYIAYFTIMFLNTRISNFVRSKFERKKSDIKPERYQQAADARLSIISAYGAYIDTTTTPGYGEEHQKTLDKIEAEDQEKAHQSLFRRPDGTWFQKCIFYYTWPLQLILKCTMPNPKIHPKLFPITFIMCIVWIGINSYIVSWMISIIGRLTNLPDSVLGMTFIAAGACLPESISMTIIARRGEGAFGVSNSLGANSMNILYSLGMPWFFKTLANGASKNSPVVIQSGSIEYTILALIFVAVSLYTTLACNGFRLSKRTGVILIVIYITMVVLSVVSEMLFLGDTKKC
ncbi:unnamed protein product [Phaedon cochleariae]|uniref:Sodium/calcium exchanger membrane region domain-containing protein n=1 Tax=Phaedon cochleariae TaxID=80249 RepID=A0A9N9X5M9_PHACE|nr:unnamed protein product [Phaedon cochleariae]